jgi:hypothetical protein
MSYESRLYERIALMGEILPQEMSTAAAASALSSLPSGGVDMSTAEKCMCVIQVGSSGTGVIKASIQAGSAGTGTASTARAWTSFATGATATVGSGGVAVIEVNSAEMPDDYTHLMLVLENSSVSNDTVVPVAVQMWTTSNRYSEPTDRIDTEVTL